MYGKEWKGNDATSDSCVKKMKVIDLETGKKKGERKVWMKK